MNPRAYDEPTSALDPELRQQVERLILSLKEDGVTQIIVTHDLVFAENVGDQLLKFPNSLRKEKIEMKTSFLFALIAGLLLLQAVRTKTSADNWATINEEKKSL